MPTLALINQKGGVGKTTAAIHLAHWLRSRGHTVFLVDADAQQSSTDWIIDPDRSFGIATVEDATELARDLPAIQNQFDFIICDAPAGLSEATRAILICSDLAIVPVQPSGVDIRSSAAAAQLLRQARLVRGDGRPRGVMFLSRAVNGTRLKTEAIAALGGIEDIPLLSAVIHQRQVIADASGQNCTVWDLGRNASQDEFSALFEEILSHV